MLLTPKNKKSSKWNFLRGSILVIEGNIASGKSTLTENLVDFLTEQGLDAMLYKEPILQSYLDMFIGNQPKYAFGFQMAMLLENQCMYSDAVEHVKAGGVAIMDRSFLGNQVFAQVHLERGNMSHDEFEVYEDVYKRMDGFFPNPDFIVYLEVDPKTNVYRCKLRDRSCESDNYDIKYFEDLNRNYLKLVKQVAPYQNVLIFDWNRDRNSQEQKEGVLEILETIREFSRS